MCHLTVCSRFPAYAPVLSLCSHPACISSAFAQCRDEREVLSDTTVVLGPALKEVIGMTFSGCMQRREHHPPELCHPRTHSVAPCHRCWMPATSNTSPQHLRCIHCIYTNKFCTHAYIITYTPASSMLAKDSSGIEQALGSSDPESVYLIRV